MRSLFKYYFAIIPTFFALSAQAQEAAAEVVDAPNPNSVWNKQELLQPLGLAMISAIILLLIAILVLSNILKLSGKAFVQRLRNERTKGTTVMMLIASLLLPQILFAQEVGDPAVTAGKMIGGLSQTSFFILFAILILEIITIIILANAFKHTIGIEQVLRGEAVPKKVKVKKISWWEKWNRTRSVEGVAEEDVSTGHDYDGIKELDNPTPPWWQLMFIAGVLFGVIYLWRYEVANSAPNQLEELAMDQAEAQEEINKYMATASSNVDENTVKLSVEPADLAAGKTIFIEKCAACHLDDGGGSVGPNLTDDFWIHGCTINDIFKTVKYGVPDKGMISWKEQLTPTQIAQVSNFIKSLHGTTPKVAKEKQGEQCVAGEPSAVPGASADSSAAAPEASEMKP